MVGIQYLKRNKKKYKYGDYVRTKKGTFDIVTEPKANIGVVRCKKTKYWREDIIKHSKNIIDLIEVGDYVNENRVYKITSACIYCVGKAVQNKLTINIETILTKEQYQANCYTVERKK